MIFEHPLTERIRSFLRLESVIADARERLCRSEVTFSRAALASLLEACALTERGELKREILSELERQRIVLGHLQDSAQIDEEKLREALATLDREYAAVASLPERLGQALKANEFLAALRSRSAMPGGTCSFDLPGLHCWLMRPAQQRQGDLEHWLSELMPLARALDVVLGHTRVAAEPEPVNAEGGIYEYVPPGENPPVLLRILLDRKQCVYPQVSASRHRITIQFQRWTSADSRAEVLREDVPFTLALCRL